MCSSQKQKRKKEREKLFEVANKNNKEICLNSSMSAMITLNKTFTLV